MVNISLSAAVSTASTSKGLSPQLFTASSQSSRILYAQSSGCKNVVLWALQVLVVLEIFRFRVISETWDRASPIIINVPRNWIVT